MVWVVMAWCVVLDIHFLAARLTISSIFLLFMPGRLLNIDSNLRIDLIFDLNSCNSYLKYNCVLVLIRMVVVVV